MVMCSPSFNVIEFIYKISIAESDGTNKLVSSAYLRRIFTLDIVLKSLSMTTNSMGPIPDPRTILVFISALADKWPSH